MAVIIMSTQDDGTWVNATALADAVLEAAPDTVVRMVKGTVAGVQVSDAAAVKYLMTRYTTKGNARTQRSGSDG